MSELLQSGQFPGASGNHPDADRLSAFVEQALPSHEREQVLAHLAVCPDCRETVALSLPHLEAPPVPEPARRSWTRGWSIFVPAALALAASVFFVVHVSHTNTGLSVPAQPAQIAASQPPSPIAPPQHMPAPSVTPHPEDRARAENRVAVSPPNPVVRGQLDAFAVAPQAAPSAPAVAAGEDKKAAADAMHGSIVGQIALAPAAAPLPPTANAPLGSVTQTVDVAREAPLLETSSIPLELRLAQPAARAVVFKHPLPSGQEVLSVATNDCAMLAIDTHNAVFFSSDSGEHWTAVSKPWQGHAVNVNLVSHAAAGAPAAGGAQHGNMVAFAAARLSPAISASLTGTITDASGAVIPGATVTIQDTATSAKHTVTTDASGRYLADDLTPGSYNIEANAPGFMTQQMDHVAIQASRQTAENLMLQVGSVSESVTVEAEAQPTGGPRAAKSEALKSAPATVAPQTIFEITTDTGEHWTSTDGVAWQRR